MALMHLFKDNPTEGATDGSEVSSGNESAPITFTLDASRAESKAAKLAVRCDANYSLEGGAAVSFTGTNADKWQCANDNGYTSATALTSANWQDTIIVPSVASTNRIFWVKASSATSELPQNDRTVDVVVEGLVVAAE